MSPANKLAPVLEVQQDGDGVWIGQSDGVRLPQLFGGQLVAQSVVAAGRDMPDDRQVHSIHTTFLRPGSTKAPVRFEVERLRDGRQFSTRVVSAMQDGRLLCRSTVACAVSREGISHSRPRPVVAPPEDSIDLRELAEEDGGLGEYWDDFSTVEIRISAVEPSHPATHSAAPVQNIWMRVIEPLGDDPLVHRAAIAYASDLMMMSMAVAPHGHIAGHERTLAERWTAVSLDHTLWFHRHARADEWMLFEHASPTAAEGRVLIDAAVFTSSGDQIVHAAQEAFLRANDEFALTTTEKDSR